MANTPNDPTRDKRDIVTRLGAPGGGFPAPVEEKITQAATELVEAVQETLVQEGGRRAK